MWPSAVTKHGPASPGDGATYEIHVHGTSPGRPRVTFVHVLPPSRVTWRFPSSVPTHTTFGSRGDSPMAYTVQWFSAPELSTDRPPDLSCCSFAGSFVVRSGEIFCTVYAIGESPRDPNVVWVGTDDGNLQVTRDGGKTWTNVTRGLPGLVPCTWISYVAPSPGDAGTCFVTADGHMLGDFTPHVFVTRDYGHSWTALTTPEMQGYAHVVRQDPVNPDLLFAGTEWGLYGSLDGGKQWAQIRAGIPNVAVRDLAIQPREGDLLVATHGRGIYVIDDLSPLRSLTQI